MPRFPYAVVFVCRPDEVVVVAVAHMRREPLYWAKGDQRHAADPGALVFW